MSRQKKDTVMTTENQTALPEVVAETKAGQELQAQILDLEKLSNRLEKTTEYIRKEVSGVAKSFCRIGYKLWEAKEDKLYLGQGYKNISEYGEKVLGFQKSSTANYIAICERFSVKKNDKPTAQLVSDFASFSYTQLSLMLSMPDEKLAKVTPETSCKKIRELKKGESSELEETEGEQAPLGGNPKSISIFGRVLQENHIEMIVKLLHENIGRSIEIFVDEYEVE